LFEKSRVLGPGVCCGRHKIPKSYFFASEIEKIAGRQAGKKNFLPYSVTGDMKLDVPLNYYGSCAYRRANAALFEVFWIIINRFL
jgi:hypothetical protein